MSVNRTKVLETAQKHLAKGNYDKAIGEFRKLVETDPSDVRTWLKIGDLYTRKGARREAIDTYSKVASQYGDQGFFLKAVAVYKQILKLDPSRLDVQVNLGEMYEMLQLTSDALSTYEHVAAGFARGGDIDRALSTLAKMADIDPENIPVRIKLAEALSKAGRTKEAADAFEAGAALLEAHGRMDDFIKVAERLLFHRADDTALARKLAGHYLERNDPKRALGKLQLCFKANPKDTNTLELLAEAFNQLGQLPKTISVYREIARIHQEANRPEDRARTLKKILELDPGDAEARQALASFAQTRGSVRRDIAPPASAVVEPSRSSVVEPDEPEIVEEVEVLEDDEELIIVEDEVDEEELASEPATEAAPAPSDMPSVPPDVLREAQIARLLTECDVFLRYGLKQKVVEQLHAVLELDPMHVEARERLKDLHLADGRVADAVAELITLAEILAEGRSAASVLYLRQVLELDPANIEARERLAALGVESIPPPEPAAVTPAEPAPIEEEEEIFFVDNDAPPDAAADITPVPGESIIPVEIDSEPVEAMDVVDATATSAAPLPPADEAPTTAADAPSLDVMEAQASRHAMVPPPSEQAQPLVPKPGDSAERPLVPRPGVPRPGAVSGPGGPVPSGGNPLAPMTPEEFEHVPLRPSTPGQMAAEVARRSVAPGEVEELLDEADFFVAQGLFEEARATLSDALTNHPSNPLIEEKLREVAGVAAAAGDRASAAPPTASADHSFELAERLAEEFEDAADPDSIGSDVLDVEQVFAQFKKGVEQQVGMEDSETHFDLGIAYKEMGLLDDAINEFRLCLTNPTRVCIGETMIGLCLLEKNELTEAIAHFKKGLYAETKTDREELGLYFELGNAYDLLHDPKEALYYYQKVQKRDPSFRDVASRIQNLAQPQVPTADAPAMAPDDIDRAFDDLMGED